MMEIEKMGAVINHLIEHKEAKESFCIVDETSIPELQERMSQKKKQVLAPLTFFLSIFSVFHMTCLIDDFGTFIILEHGQSSAIKR